MKNDGLSVFSNRLKTVDQNRTFTQIGLLERRGSMLVAGAFFLVIFLMVGALAVDISRYFSMQRGLQGFADNAAKAGAEAFNQFKVTPNTQHVRDRIMSFMRRQRGDRYTDLYRVKEDGTIEGIYIRKIQSPELSKKLSCPPDFKITNNTIQPTEPFDVESQVIGAYLGYGDGTRVPTTAKLTLTHPDKGTVADSEPWGPLDDPGSGNVNTGQYKNPFSLKNMEAQTEIQITARGYHHEEKISGQPLINEVKTGVKDPELDHRYPALYFRDGDKPPDVPGGLDQPDVASYLKKYVKDGRYELQQNQVIVAVDVYSSSGNLDYNDFIVLLTLNRAGSTSGGSGGAGGGASKTISAEECGVYYRIGVTTYAGFQPKFLPTQIFGDKPRLMSTHAVAEAHPKHRKRYSDFRRGPIGLIKDLPSNLHYPKPTSDNVKEMYGVSSSGGASCDKNADFAVCSSTSDFTSSFAPIDDQRDRIYLSNQVIYVPGSLKIDSSSPYNNGTVSSLRGNGYMIVEGDITIANSGAINGNLDLVSRNGNIVFKDISNDMSMRGYLIAQNGRIELKNVDSSVNLELYGGGFHKSGPQVFLNPGPSNSHGGQSPEGNTGSGDNSGDSGSSGGSGGAAGRITIMEPLSFCPTNSDAKFCGLKVSEYRKTPYSWDVQMKD